ncbi:hypothetical protein Gotur_032738 [Gossypium turneri]
MPTLGSSFTHQDNVALENEEYTQVFDPDKYGKVLGYGRGITKSILFGYGSVTRGSQFTLAISTMIEEMGTKHAKQIQTIQSIYGFLAIIEIFFPRVHVVLHLTRINRKGALLFCNLISTRGLDDKAFSSDNEDE